MPSQLWSKSYKTGRMQNCAPSPLAHWEKSDKLAAAARPVLEQAEADEDKDIKREATKALNLIRQ